MNKIRYTNESYYSVVKNFVIVSCDSNGVSHRVPTDRMSPERVLSFPIHFLFELNFATLGGGVKHHLNAVMHIFDAVNVPFHELPPYF